MSEFDIMVIGIQCCLILLPLLTSGAKCQTVFMADLINGYDILLSDHPIQLMFPWLHICQWIRVSVSIADFQLKWLSVSLGSLLYGYV